MSRTQFLPLNFVSAASDLLLSDRWPMAMGRWTLCLDFGARSGGPRSSPLGWRWRQSSVAHGHTSLAKDSREVESPLRPLRRLPHLGPQPPSRRLDHRWLDPSQRGWAAVRRFHLARLPQDCRTARTGRHQRDGRLSDPGRAASPRRGRPRQRPGTGAHPRGSGDGQPPTPGTDRRRARRPKLKSKCRTCGPAFTATRSWYAADHGEFAHNSPTTAAPSSRAPPTVSVRRMSPIRLTSGQLPRPNRWRAGRGGVPVTGPLQQGTTMTSPTRLPGTPAQ